MYNVGAQQQPQQQAQVDYRVTVADPQRIRVGQALVKEDIEEVNLTPFVGALRDLTAGLQIAAHNPYDLRSHQAVLRANDTIQMLRRNPPPAHMPFVGAVVEPFAQALQLMIPAVKAGLQVRVEQGERMLQQPTIAIPVNVDLPPGGATTSIELKNPYLGSGGTSYRDALWAITAIEAPPAFLLQGCCGPGANVLFTELKFAGHDYVNAGLQGITNWPNNQGRGAVRGYPIWMFSADKTYRRATAFRPWNLSGADGIVGAVMRETGSVNITIQNANSSPCVECPFLDTIIIYCSASLCGSPWDPKRLSEMYLPLAVQAQAALTLSSYQARTLSSYYQGDISPELQRMLAAYGALSSGDPGMLGMGHMAYGDAFTPRLPTL